jgi:SAM-dependent methyltransferase
VSDVITPPGSAVALYEAILDDLEIGTGTRVLDVGRGQGLFLRLAAQRGATVAGTDADVRALPFADDAFDVVTVFDAFQFAADPGSSLREAGRVACAGAPIVIATWGRPEQCEAAAYLESVGPGVPDPFALSGPGALEALAAGGGLTPGERHDVECIWSFPDEAALLRGLMSTRFAVRAIDGSGEERVAAAILEAVAPYRTSDGGYRLENVFTYLIAHT